MFITISRHQKIVGLIFAVMCVLCVSTQNVKGQEKKPVKENEYIYPSPQNTDNLFLYGMMATNCEATRSNMDLVMEEAYRNKNLPLIIIFRLEIGERSNLYDFRRKDLTSFLQRYYTGKYVTALGNRVEKIGRADIYVGGRLAFGLGFNRNSKKLCIR